MGASDVQVFILMDVVEGAAEPSPEKLLPPERMRLDVLRLSAFGAPKLKRPPHNTEPVDWYSIGEAIEKLAVRVHEIQEAARPNAMQLYVGGRAPLAAYVHLGSMFTKSVANVIVFNTVHVGSDRWEAFPTDGGPIGMPTPDIFDKLTDWPKVPSSTTGRVGLVIDSGRRADSDSEPTEVFEKFLTDCKQPVGSIVQMRSWDSQLTITDVHMPAIVRQLAQRMSTLPHLFSKRSGLALFVAGPVQVAFVLGRSINANVLVGDVMLTEYVPERNEYEKVYSLPFVFKSEMEIPQTDAAIRVRQEVLYDFIEALGELKAQIKSKHLPKKMPMVVRRKEFVKRLENLTIDREDVRGQPFELRTLEGVCRIGEGILEALINSARQQRKDFAKLLLLHELVHDMQILRNTNHDNIGTAGFVLEHVDYLADVFAVRVLINVELSRGGPDARRNLRARVQHWLDMVLHGITAFDRAEQRGKQMERLPERRLRRYLLWHVQKARALTLETPKQFERMMNSSLTVELAPLTGFIDTKRWEKMVRDCLPTTALCIAIDGKLIRQRLRDGFDPQALFDGIRTYEHDKAHKQVYAVVNENRDALMPWTQEK